MKKILSIGVGVAIFIWFSVSLNAIGHIANLFYSEDSCIPAMSNNEWVKEVESVLRKVPDNKERLLLQDFTPFEWDSFFIFAPYSLDTRLISIFGFQPKLLGCTGIYFRDDINLLVFEKDDALVAFGDVSNIIVWYGIKSGEAVESHNSWFCINKHDNYIELERCKTNSRVNFDSKNGG